MRGAANTGEHYDVVVVGAGFAGCTAAYTYLKARPNAAVLIFDNHAIFGGEARHNEFEVDGYKLWGPQGSTGAVWPLDGAKKIGMYSHMWEELGLPTEFVWQEATNTDLKIPFDTYSPMHLSWEKTDLVDGYTQGSGNQKNRPMAPLDANLSASGFASQGQQCPGDSETKTTHRYRRQIHNRKANRDGCQRSQHCHKKNKPEESAQAPGFGCAALVLR